MMCIVMLLSALMFLFVGRTGAELRLQRISTCTQQAQWEANGQMNIAMFKIGKATYNFQGHNTLLVENADTGSPIPGTAVYATSVAGAEGWYTLEARVMSGSNLHRVRTMVCEKDTLAHFSRLSFYHGLYIGESIGGDIHSNRNVRFQNGNLVLPGNVTTAGILEYEGIGEGDVTVQQILQDDVDSIPYPDLLYVYGLGVAPYIINAGNGCAEITFQNDSVKVTTYTTQNNGNAYGHIKNNKDKDKNKSQTNTYPLPPDGAIIVYGDAYVEGDLQGRVTIFCSGSIGITGNLRYVDANGETAYLNGASTDHDYVPNPNYTGESCLGLVACNNIEITSNVPSKVEVNAVTYTIMGHVGIEGYGLNSFTEQFTYYDPTFHKNSIRHLGSIISGERSVYGIYFLNTLLSGFSNRKIVYDDKAGLRPPPHFPALNRPYFTGWEVIR